MANNELLYEGKAKSIYATENPGELLAVFRDDITAFNGEKKYCFSGKGVYNATVSAFFFTMLEEKGIKTHFKRLAGERSMVVSKLDMIPLEVLGRNRAAGSLVRKFPFKEGQVLNPPLVMTDYKCDERGDPPICDDVIFALGLLTPDELRQIREITFKINELLYNFFDALDLVLADFKIEFGKSGNDIVLGDEISMDSMRLWDKETGESLDKDVYRFGKGDVMSAYARVVEKIEEWKKENI